MIEVKDFHKTYETTVAVAGISFRVKAGEVMGLIGPNGAGKTTTLRSVAGIIPASRGRLVVAGFDVQLQPLSAKRRLAYVPDDPPIFSDLTVAEHLTFTAGVYRVGDADAKEARLLQDFELMHKQSTPARDLSRGMRQKLAIACALLHDPLAILLDEPLTGLDPHAIRTLKKTIIQRANEGVAVMISSHLLAMVEDVCTNVMILDRGQQQFFGTMGELRAMYQLESKAASLEDIFFAATSDTCVARFGQELETCNELATQANV
jgi:ABC-2 type transport system ATP-binding protein